MDKVDQFESAFRSADKEVFLYRRMALSSVLVVTDLEAEAAERFAAEVKSLTAMLREQGDVTYVTLTRDRFHSPKELLDLVQKQRPDLIATYRCLHSEAWRWGFTLGAYIDVLTQATSTPVLLLPHPADEDAAARRRGGDTSGKPDRVMAVTDHLAGDAHLVNAALALVAAGGTLFPSHVEDDATFERYMGVISRIPDIDTELARERIQAQLLKEPKEYIRSVSETLKAIGVTCAVQPQVTLGHHVKQYREMVEAHAIDLLVMNTKDEDHSAMHGIAYSLAVELRDTPLLML